MSVHASKVIKKLKPTTDHYSLEVEEKLSRCGYCFQLPPYFATLWLTSGHTLYISPTCQ